MRFKSALEFHSPLMLLKFKHNQATKIEKLVIISLSSAFGKTLSTSDEKQNGKSFCNRGQNELIDEKLLSLIYKT
jgi:hypothetical protein